MVVQVQLVAHSYRLANPQPSTWVVWLLPVDLHQYRLDEAKGDFAVNYCPSDQLLCMHQKRAIQFWASKLGGDGENGAKEDRRRLANKLDIVKKRVEDNDECVHLDVVVIKELVCIQFAENMHVNRIGFWLGLDFGWSLY